MEVTTLHETEQALRDVPPDELGEMVYQLARSHAFVCGLTSQIGGCAHVSDEEIRDRVERLGPAELAAALAPSAWLSMDLQHRMGT